MKSRARLVSMILQIINQKSWHIGQDLATITKCAVFSEVLYSQQEVLPSHGDGEEGFFLNQPKGTVSDEIANVDIDWSY